MYLGVVEREYLLYLLFAVRTDPDVCNREARCSKHEFWPLAHLLD